jgi:hypothetical protein
VVGSVFFIFSRIGVQFVQSFCQWEARSIPEEMSQTLLTNKKQGNLDEEQSANIIKPTKTRMSREKYTFPL